MKSEVFPEFFNRSIEGYPRLISKDLFVDETWMKIVFQGEPVGFTRTSVERDDSNAMNNTTIFNEMHLKINLLGSSQNLKVDSKATLDVLSRLQDFSFDFSSRDYRMQVRGARKSGDLFRVSVRTGETVRSKDVFIPDDVIIYSPMVQIALTNLRPGQQYTMKTLDPLTMESVPVKVKAIKREPLSLGTNYWPDALLLEMKHRDITIQTWIDRDGRVLKQDTPFGWNLEYCSFDQAMAALRKASSVDLAASLGVISQGSIRNPSDAPWIRLRIKGADMADWIFPSPRVVVESSDDNGLVIKLLSGRSIPKDLSSQVPSGISSNLAPTIFVQSDDKLIKAQASRIVIGAKNDMEKAELLFDWVKENMTKDVAVTFPSALDVLKTMRGDCNEHTVLYTALARSVGLPAKMIAGLAYVDGKFMYHAWPAVWVGGWIELDPTWGISRVSATHLPLVEGELSDQMRLARVLGRLRIEIIEEGEVLK